MKIKNKLFLITIAFFFILFGTVFVYADNWINLDGKKAEININNSQTLDGYTQMTWNIWVFQNQYTTNAGLIGKYMPVNGGRSYLIRTSLVNGISIVISNDGTNIGSYSTSSDRQCGIRNNNEWTMITLSYNGTHIRYYRNGKYCDTDSTPLNHLASSSSPLRLGGGNNVFFNGSIDDVNIYNKVLTPDQINRLYDENIHGNNKGQSIPVLVYHRIESPTPDLVEVSPNNFNEQMQFLKNNNFTSITTRDYNNWKNSTFTMPKKSVILFFDDGWNTVYTNAKPIMDQYNFKGTLATVINYASNNGRYMNWTQIQTLAKSGWQIESHGISHAHMLTLNTSQFIDQLNNSKINITQKIGVIPESFVFPFHESNSKYTQICGQYYDLCWTQGSTIPTYDYKSTDGKVYLSLRRINIVNDTTIQQFENIFGKDINKASEWLFDEGFGNNSIDSSDNRNTAVLVNGAAWNSLTNSALLKANSINSIQLKPTRSKSMNPKLDTVKHINDGLGGNIIDTDQGKKSNIKKDRKNSAQNNMPIEKDKS